MAKKKAEPKKPGKGKPLDATTVSFAVDSWRLCRQAVVFSMARYRELKRGPTPKVCLFAKAHHARLRDVKRLLDSRKPGQVKLKLSRVVIKLLRESVCEAKNWCDAMPGRPRQESFSGTRDRTLQNDFVFDAVWEGREELTNVLATLNSALAACYEKEDDRVYVVPPYQWQCLKSEA